MSSTLSKQDWQKQNVVSKPTIEGVRVGKVIRVSDSGQVYVDYTGNHSTEQLARYTQSINENTLIKAVEAQQDVLLAFENNDPTRPIIIDILHSYIQDVIESQPVEMEVEELKDVTFDGKRVTFDAKEQIVLKCGKSSITLTKAGKILIRGAYLSSRSSGVNRIKGGSVQVN